MESITSLTFEKKCAQCGATRSAQIKLQKCAKCTSVRYCGTSCQKTHWTVHRPRCKEITARQAANAAHMNELFDSALDILKKRDFRSFRSLLDENPSLVYYSSNEFGLSNLMHICGLVNFKDGIQILIDRGADINLPDTNGITPLYLACQEGHKDIVKLLLDKQADINVQITYGATPLYVACDGGHRDIVKMLLDKQADVNLQTTNGITPLYISCKEGHTDIVKMLLDKQADVNLQVTKVLLLFISHVWNGHKDIVKMLLDKQADVSSGY
jgi:ankyrin repeat protein